MPFKMVITTEGNVRGVDDRARPSVALATYIKAVEELDGLTLVLGVDGREQTEDGLDYSTLAEMLEYGFWNERAGKFVPGRPFLTSALTKHQDKYVAILLKYISKNIGGANLAMKELTRVVKTDMEVFLMDKNNGLARNAPATIKDKERRAAKGERDLPSDLPIVDSGKMMRSIVTSWYVEGKSKNTRVYLSAKDAEERLEALAKKYRR